ncbi:MAG: hypothetical protein ACO2PP_26715 [Thermocrinis sp.]|mgnify:CR=1 FL=1|jgi:hypothetical protein|uniref:hypothetical protein n=1 Tax=Thermocrinis sp. TaxID=2024383 RepID=UPI003C060658
MRYKVKLTYPTIVVIEQKEYLLFPGHEVELPDSAEVVKTYEGLGYLEPLPDKQKTKKEVNDGSS